MDPSWDDLREQFEAALVSAFPNRGDFRLLLLHKCKQTFGLLITHDSTYPQEVSDVVGHAASNGWLECLIKGALAKNPDNVPLQEVASAILVGIEAEGTSFYQPGVNIPQGTGEEVSGESRQVDDANEAHLPLKGSSPPVLPMSEEPSAEVEVSGESGQVDDSNEAPFPPVLLTSDEPPDEEPPEKPPSKPPSILVINIILLAIFIFLVTPRVISALSSQWVSCAPDLITSICLSIIILLLLHAAWRVLSGNLGAANQNIEILGVKIPIGSVKAILDNGHPWVFSDGIFLGGIFIGIIVIVLLTLTRLSPTNEQPTAPILANFEVSVDDDSESDPLPVGQELLMQRGEVKRISAVTGVQRGVKCDWNPEDGTIIEDDGCTIVYVAPADPDKYFVAVKISSACSLQSLDHGLFVEVP